MRKIWGVSLIMVGIVILIFTINSGNIFNMGSRFFNTEHINIDKAIDASNINKLVVQSASTDILVIKGQSDYIQLRLQGDVSSKYADRINLSAEPKDGTLEVGIDKSDGFNIGFSFTDIKLTVELPDKQWKELNIKANSGNIDLAQIKGDFIQAHTSSGNIQLNKIQSTKMNLKTSSGDIHAEEFISEQLTFNTSSGNATLIDGEAQLHGETNSGDIELQYEELLHHTELKTTSGSVAIELNKEPQSLALDYKSNSGNGDIDWSGFKYEEKNDDLSRIKGTFGNGNAKLKVNTNSGDFNLDQK
ncbi:hypothetical protein D3C73_696660 [compost metagenome]